MSVTDTRAAHRPSRRQEVVDAAIRVFANGGLRASLAEVARDCGMSQAAIYYHFASKDDLLIAAVREIGEQLTRVTEQQDGREAPRSPSEVIDVVWDWVSAHQEEARLLYVWAAAGPPAVAAVRREFIERHVQLARRRFSQVHQPSALDDAVEQLATRTYLSLALTLSEAWVTQQPVGGVTDRGEVVGALARVSSRITQWPAPSSAGGAYPPPPAEPVAGEDQSDDEGSEEGASNPANGRRPAHRPSRKKHFLALALEEFAANGLDSASMAEIAASADMAPASAYYHFSSKDEVIDTLVTSVYKRVLDALTPAEDEADVASWVHGAVERVCHWIRSSPLEARFILVVAEAPRSPVDLERQRHVQWESIGALARVVQSYDPHVSHLDAAVMSAGLLALALEWARTHLDPHEGDPTDVMSSTEAATHVAFRVLGQAGSTAR